MSAPKQASILWTICKFVITNILLVYTSSCECLHLWIIFTCIYKEILQNNLSQLNRQNIQNRQKVQNRQTNQVERYYLWPLLVKVAVTTTSLQSVGRIGLKSASLHFSGIVNSWFKGDIKFAQNLTFCLIMAIKCTNTWAVFFTLPNVHEGPIIHS